MTLAEQVTEYVHAAFAGLWVQTSEPDEAERELVEHGRQRNWVMAAWGVAAGLRRPGTPGETGIDGAAGDPLAAMRALAALADPDGTAVLLLHQFHRFLNNPEVVQTVFAQLVAGKQQRTFLVILAPTVQLPVELEKLFVVVEHALPDRDQLEEPELVRAGVEEGSAVEFGIVAPGARFGRELPFEPEGDEAVLRGDDFALQGGLLDIAFRPLGDLAAHVVDQAFPAEPADHRGGGAGGRWLVCQRGAISVKW